MQIINRPRGAGKTTELIKLAAERFAYIVCPRHEDCRRIAEHAKTLNLDIPYPITWQEYIEGRYYRKGVREFMIDDIDRCLETTTKAPVTAISINREER